MIHQHEQGINTNTRGGEAERRRVVEGYGGVLRILDYQTLIDLVACSGYKAMTVKARP
jgi:hypothetical protein